MRRLGITYRTAWLVHHKLVAAMAEWDALEPLTGDVQLDDAYIGGERPGVGNRGSPNMVPIVAVVSTSNAGRPMRVKVAAMGSFAREAIASWAKANLLPGCDVRSDGLSCFAGVIDAGCEHSSIAFGQRKPRGMPPFTWVNAILGNFKTMIGGGYEAFKFSKYSNNYLGAFAYSFNHRVDLKSLLLYMIGNAATCSPTRERQIRGDAEVHNQSEALTQPCLREAMNSSITSFQVFNHLHAPHHPDTALSPSAAATADFAARRNPRQRGPPGRSARREAAALERQDVAD